MAVEVAGEALALAVEVGIKEVSVEVIAEDSSRAGVVVLVAEEASVVETVAIAAEDADAVVQEEESVHAGARECWWSRSDIRASSS